ncbi:MAG TPA: ABC transporter ATP-binding protein, partial [Patescibacteria group bacterium]|nr:ABC transporter ATP-binding protein [Patescibacteria group bacterium]
TTADAHALFTQLTTILGIVFALHIGSWLCGQWGWSGIATLEPKVMAELEQSAFQKILGQSYRFFTNSFTGSLVKRVNRITRSFESIFDTCAGNLLPLFITVIGIIAVLFQRNVWVALSVLVWTALFLILNYFFTVKKLHMDVERAMKDTEVSAVMADALTNSINVKLFNGTREETKRLRKVSNELKNLRLEGWRYHRTVDFTQTGLMIAIEFGVMCLAIPLWQKGLLTIGDFALFQGYLINLFGQLNNARKLIRKLFEAFAEAKETVDVLDLPYEIEDSPSAKKLLIKEARIEFKHASFGYESGQPLLRELSTIIQPKEKIALVGPSGAGKSTIIKLLLRFFDLDRGEILIDGQSISGVTQESLREAIALVPQEPILFHRTLMENIRYGRRDASDREVIEAAKRAQCHEFIQRLPYKYETFVGERGIKLSGGERQRVAIARAILKNAPILLLDEATSSLDSESESAIQEALRELMKDKTTIAIAHRLSTIMQMDRILVMEHGQITDSGTHETLLGKRGIYHTLWKIQAGGFVT